MNNEITEEPQEIIEIDQEAFNEIVCLVFTTERHGRLLHYSLINLVNKVYSKRFNCKC